MRIRELIVEGQGPFAEAVRYSFGAGHVVVRPDDPVLGWLGCLLFGAAPPSGWEGRLEARIEEGGQERGVERRVDALGGGDALVPEGAFWILRPNPRPIVLGPREREELRALLPKLEAELRAQEEMERLDSQMQALGHELSQLDARLEELERARAARDAAVRKAEPFRAVDIPADIEERIRAFEEAREKKREKVDRIRSELAKTERLEKESQVDLLRDRRFWVSVGAGALFFLVGLFSPWKGLAILSIPAFGVGAGLALAAISTLQQREEAGQRRAFLQERLDAAERADAGAFPEIDALLAATGSADVDEMRAWMRRANEVEEEVRLAAERLSALEAREENRTAAERRAQVAAAIEAGEKQLSALAAGSFRSAGEIRHEMAEIRRKLDGGEGAQDLSIAFLEAACRCLGCDRAALLQAVGKRASQLLAALTEERWKSVGWGGSGGMALKGAEGVVRFADLVHEDREAARAALLFAAAEQSAGGAGGIVLLDAPFDDLDPGLQARLARALRWLGERGVQIVHRTGVEVFRRAANVLEAA